MDWIFVAVLSGSIVTSGHSTEEGCLGRKALIERDSKIIGTCIKAPSHNNTWTYGTYNSCPGSACSTVQPN